MKINNKELKKWIKALDSGKYEQGKAQLQTGDNKFCCLGVGCKVLIPEDKQEKSLGLLNGVTPAGGQRYAPEWLKKINSDFGDKTDTTLITLNDSSRFSFSEIATLLELVYIYKILD